MADEEEDIEEEVVQGPPPSKLVFVNNVDSYTGSAIAKYLSRCIIGASLNEIEDDEEAETEVDDESKITSPVEGTYKIIGTLKSSSNPKPAFVEEVVVFNAKEELYQQILRCDIIIYHIVDDASEIDEAVWAVSQLHSDIDNMVDVDRPYVFILISSVLTWARSKPVDSDDPEIPFTETDFRRRKAHPNFKEHIAAEKLVTKLGKMNKKKLITYVIASGLMYGEGENILRHVFNSAWNNAAELSCFGDGQNIIPTIHVNDLAAILQNVLDSSPKTKYIVAVDDSNNTLEEITRAISRQLSTGKIKKIAKEDILLARDVKQGDIDHLLMNLRLDATLVKEQMHVRWAAETGIVDAIEPTVASYKEIRGLQPMRVVILGPPAVGKSTVAEQLCEYYKLHHIHVKNVIDEGVDRMQKYLARLAAAEEEEEEAEETDLDYDDPGKAAEYQELLDAISDAREQGSRLEEQTLTRLFRDRLHSKPCQNQGFVLDGYPKTIDQAKELFSGEDEEEASSEQAYDRLIMPRLVVSLEASDEFLRERVVNLPELVVVGTHNTDEPFTRRLNDHRALNTDEDTVLNYFDELEFHPERIDVEKDTSLRMSDTVEKIKQLMTGQRTARTWLTDEELEEEKLREMEKVIQREADKREERERVAAEEALMKARRQEEWAQRLEDVKREEQQLLEAQSTPLRNYLMQNVMPTMTHGLIECCRVRPDDPIDFLAEYIFKHS